MKRALLALVVVVLSAGSFGVGVALAHNDTGSNLWVRSENQGGGAGFRCWMNRPDLLHQTGSSTITYRMTVFARQHGVEASCPTSVQTYSRPMHYLGVSGMLLYNSGTQVCSSFGLTKNPAPTSDFLVSVAVPGACGSSGYFVEGSVWSLWNGVVGPANSHTNLCCVHNL